MALAPGTKLHEFEIVTLIGAGGMGSRLSFLVERELQDVYLSELERGCTALGRTRRLTLDDRRDSPSGWLSDNSAILFHSDRVGSRNPYRYDLDENVTASLYIGPDKGMGARQSSDGEWIFFWYGDELRRIPVGGGPPELVLGADRSNGSRFDCVFEEKCLMGMRDNGDYAFLGLDPTVGRGAKLLKIEDRPRSGEERSRPTCGLRLRRTGAISRSA